MKWSELLDGCDVLATLNKSGEAYGAIRGSIVAQLVEEKKFSSAVAEKVVDDVVRERERAHER